ncbi:MAG TPA: prepilin-type N-terminal cleavage/methylation domain-containing protein [Proteobacteria bacterium]|nr:prepilin-type N-terminal cleavage/methylation domain-containing protein [Pseudomonadota bacterium]
MKKVSDNKGFTLIELLISMALLGLVLAALTSLFASTNRSYSSQNMVVTMQGNARAAMDFVTRTMKGLKSITILNGEGTSDSDITFTTDETAFGGGVCTHRFSRYDSQSDGPGTLGYSYGCPTITGNRQPLAPNITRFTLQRIGTPTTRINITITAETPHPRPDTGTKGTFILTSSVDLRN